MERNVRVIENFEDYTDWTVLSNDTENLAALEKGVFDQQSIEFDKKDGTDDLTCAGAYKEISATSGRLVSTNFWEGDYSLQDDICLAFYVGALTNIASAFVRLGTSVSHYFEWRFHDSQMSATSWNIMSCKIGNCVQVGNGADLTNIVYLAVGVNFDAAGDALADIGMNQIYLEKTSSGTLVTVTD